MMTLRQIRARDKRLIAWHEAGHYTYGISLGFVGTGARIWRNEEVKPKTAKEAMQGDKTWRGQAWPRLWLRGNHFRRQWHHAGYGMAGVVAEELCDGKAVDPELLLQDIGDEIVMPSKADLGCLPAMWEEHRGQWRTVLRGITSAVYVLTVSHKKIFDRAARRLLRDGYVGVPN
jgi:hypothetical protein